MLTDYIQAAMRRAKYEVMEDGQYFGSIPGFQGLWAAEKTARQCEQELQSSLEDWILVSAARHLPIPVIDGMDLNVKEVA